MAGAVTELPLWKRTLIPVLRAADAVLSIVFVPIAFGLAAIARFVPKRIDVGLGPEPLINNVFHKRALERYGYTVETFVDQVYFITAEFDYRADRVVPKPFYFLRGHWLFVRAVFRYRCLYIYFNGGPLMNKMLLWRLEPMLYRVAGVATVVMPYGADVQDMTRSPNLRFKHAMSMDYRDLMMRRREIAAQVEVWTRGATHIISGCEWVDYMYHWDTLMLAHFSFDVDACEMVAARVDPSSPLRVLHAPNHRNVKGTDTFIKAIEELKLEGVEIDLQLLQGVPNSEVREAIARADVVADQLVVGWYAMFAIEAMATGKAVLCYLRDDLTELYESVGLIAPGDNPVVNCSPRTVKRAIRDLAQNRQQLLELGRRGRAFVSKYHSLESVGRVFDGINRSMGMSPKQPVVGEA